MPGLKSLAKDTAIYGTSSILGKILNWLLTPFFTFTLQSTGELGIVTSLYAYVAIIIVILTFGMETGLFRFANKKDGYAPTTVYSTTLISVGTVVVLFFILVCIFLQPITDYLGKDSVKYEILPSYVLMMAMVLSMDAFSCIPFAYLRLQKRPIKFAALKMLQIILYIILCCFFLLACPYIYEKAPHLIDWFYDPDFRVGYIFVSNLIATFIQTVCLFKELIGFKYKFDFVLFRKMLHYCLPLLILGIAGMMSQTFDKIIFPSVYSGEGDPLDELGIYGACFKLGVVMVMFTQAFRYAYEPFIFSNNAEKDNKKSYADAMKYFIIIGLIIFLGVCFYMDIIKIIIDPKYYAGLKVVPVILIGELFFGIYFNLSLWYKLTDQTHWGAILSIIGCIIIVLFNIFFIPLYGYMACAWASLIGYGVIMFISYFLGQKKFPIKYDLKTIGLYFSLALVLYFISIQVQIDNLYLRLLFRTALLGIYLLILYKRDNPLRFIKIKRK